MFFAFRSEFFRSLCKPQLALEKRESRLDKMLNQSGTAQRLDFLSADTTESREQVARTRCSISA